MNGRASAKRVVVEVKFDLPLIAGHTDNRDAVASLKDALRDFGELVDKIPNEKMRNGEVVSSDDWCGRAEATFNWEINGRGDMKRQKIIEEAIRRGWAWRRLIERPLPYPTRVLVSPQEQASPDHLSRYAVCDGTEEDHPSALINVPTDPYEWMRFNEQADD
jgi:hypothetical protein